MINLSNWRDEIVDTVKKRNGLFLAIDPQNVLALDQELRNKIMSSGFDLLRYSDPIEFRYHYEERKFQNHLDLIIIWNDILDSAENKLIWEVLEYCKKNQSIIDCTASKIFPKLATNVIEEMDVANYDLLYNEHQKLESNQNETQTCEFILHKVFEMSSKIIANSPKTLFQTLLSIHYNSKKLTPFLIEYLMKIITQNHDFDSWNARLLLSDKEAFFEFIQREWEDYIETRNSKIDFSDRNISFSLNNLFLEGYLKQIETQRPYEDWMKIGIKIPNNELVSKQRFQEGIKLFEKEAQKLDSNSTHLDWQKLSNQYAKWMAIADEYDFSMEEVQNKINKQFKAWIDKNYRQLWSMSPINGPIMVHHILEYISKNYSESKIALVIIDGLSTTQWQIIQTILNKKNSELEFRDESIFAWIPTITSVSRQSIFSGTDPSSFKQTILTTSTEEKRWKEKWMQLIKSEESIVHSTGNYLWEMKELEKVTADSRIIGFVVMEVDDKMHTTRGGMKDFNGQIKQWAINGILDKFLIKLLNEGFEVFVSSDHGNTEAVGVGEPKDYTQERGRRCRIYDSKEQLERVQKEYPSHSWWPELYGPKFHVLLAQGRDAFSKEKETVVTHGGLSIDEVMVPFVKVSKKIVK